MKRTLYKLSMIFCQDAGAFADVNAQQLVAIRNSELAVAAVLLAVTT